MQFKIFIKNSHNIDIVSFLHTSKFALRFVLIMGEVSLIFYAPFSLERVSEARCISPIHNCVHTCVAFWQVFAIRKCLAGNIHVITYFCFVWRLSILENKNISY